jgi:hypothetical protein
VINPNAQVYGNLFVNDATSLNADQINFYSSEYETAWSNFIEMCPDTTWTGKSSKSTLSAAGIQLDVGSQNINVHDNDVINGGQVGISTYGTSNTVSGVYSNTVLGVGLLGGWTAGLQADAGTDMYNGSGWWDHTGGVIIDYYWSGATHSNNTSWGRANVTESSEQSLYNGWINYWTNHSITIGHGTLPSVTYPLSTDFP